MTKLKDTIRAKTKRTRRDSLARIVMDLDRTPRFPTPIPEVVT